MSLIKETLPIDEDLKNLNLNRTTFKNPIQMLVANSNKKSVVFPINKLEKPSLDSVLNTVPLFYNPITKQLILQQDLEHQLNNNNKVNSTITSFNCNKFNKTSFNNKKCEIRLNDKNRPNLDKETEKLNNLNKNDEFSSNCLKEEKKLLETQLDDFTTKSINLSQRPVEIKLINKDKIINNCKILNNHHQSSLNKLSDKSSSDNKSLNNKLNDKIELYDKSENQLKEEQTSINQIKKDTYKTHRRTPSYIHDFHNLIKNNNNSTNHHQIKSSTTVNKITVNSATAAIQNLTKTSLANLTSTLSSTINSTAKLNDHQMNSPIITNSTLDPKITSSPSQQQFTNKQITFNEMIKNEFNDQDTDSDGSVFLNNSHNNCNLNNNKKYSIDDNNIEPLNLPSPFGLDKPKKLSFLTEPLQSVLNKLTKTSISNSSSLNCNNLNNQTAKSQNTATNFFQSFNLNSNERRNSKNNLEVSTTGLILENRPVGLEPKNKDEHYEHYEQYKQMLKEAKRKEEKQNKKNLIKKKKDEERILNAIKIWKYEIIPNFDQVKNTKKVKELWAYIPSCVRGEIWSLAIGNKLNLTENSLNEYLSKWYDSKLDQQLKFDDMKTLKENDERIENCLSKCSDENVYELIKLDVSRTYPNLKLFQKDAPFHNLLLKVLGSYVIAYKPNIGYIQGMSFILGMFLLNMKPENAFIAFANLLETSPILMSFMNVDQIKMENFYKSFDVYFNLYLPELYQHFKQQNLNTELFMINWVNTLFTKTLPLDISTRIWDLLFKDGEEIITKTSLTLLKLYEKELLQLDFISSAQFLTQLNANNFTIENTKFFNELNNFNLKPVTIKKIKCKNFYSLYEHFNNTTNVNSYS